MKKWIIAFICSSILTVSAQTWRNGDLDGQWTTDNNWSGGNKPTDTQTATFAANGTSNINLSSAQTINAMTFQGAAQAYTFTGSELIFAQTANATVLNNNSTAPNQQVFKNVVKVTGGYNTTFNGGAGGIVFDNTFDSTATAWMQMNGTVTFNGNVKSSALRINSGATATFNNTTSNEIASFVITGSGTASIVVVNTAAGVNFYDGLRFQHNNSATFTFNNANVIGDTTDIKTSGYTVNYNFNADETLGQIILDDGQINIALGDSVSSLIFSEGISGDGVIVISNFVAGVVNFNGITAGDLTKITAYAKGSTSPITLSLDGAGNLIPEPGTIGLLMISAGGLLLARRARR